METGHTSVGVIERMIKIIKKYGRWRTFEAIVVILSVFYLLHNISNLPRIIENVFEIRTERIQMKHDEAVRTRREIKPEIDDIMNHTLSYLNADRVFVMEMHNGTNNTAGLPFIYGEMTYEEVSRGVNHVDEDYISINLSRFDFPLYLRQNRIFYGSIEELKKIDEKLAMRMISNDVTYFAIISMHGVANELGYFGVTYCNGKVPPMEENIIEQLTLCSQKLAILLDSSSNIDND